MSGSSSVHGAGAAPAATPESNAVMQLLDEAAIYYEQAAKQFREAAADLKPADPTKAKASAAAAVQSAQTGMDKLRRAKQIVEEMNMAQPPEGVEAMSKAGAKHA